MGKMNPSETDLTPEAINKLKVAPTVAGVLPIIQQRWSPRAFSKTPVTLQELKTLLDAAHWAPSSSNEQPWRFIVGLKDDPTLGGSWNKLLAILVERNQLWAKHAPVLMFTVAKRTFTAKGANNHSALHDAGIAFGFLCLQAASMGLYAHGMAGYNPDGARAGFGISEDYELGAALAIGHLGTLNELDESFRKPEVSSRERKPLSEIVFAGEFGKSAGI